MGFITPKGIAQYPWLNRPDTKFNDLGIYQVNLILDETDSAIVLAAILDAASEEGIKGNLGVKPWAEEIDDNGDNTGRMIFRFKNTNKLKRDGTIWDKKPALVNAMLQPMDNVADLVGGGSLIRINCLPYFWNVQGKQGVTLQFEAVQVLDLKVPVVADADHGFTAEAGYAKNMEANDETPFLPKKGEDKDLF